MAWNERADRIKGYLTLFLIATLICFLVGTVVAFVLGLITPAARGAAGWIVLGFTLAPWGWLAYGIAGSLLGIGTRTEGHPRRESRTVAELASRLQTQEDALRAFAPKYREIRIPKRSGGTRILHVPDAATKSLQRKILHRLLAKLTSHPAAYGFEPGRSIAHHAAQHVGRAVVLHFDVVDFFPSTHAGRIERMFLRLGWNAEAAALLTKLTTHKGGLPQGAPTSPRLSNLVNAALDRSMVSGVRWWHGRYSRYADDITVSYPEDWGKCVERTKARVKIELGRRGYEMHVRKKLSVRRRHQRQVVTGLVVNDKVALPRTLRRKLRAARHHLATGRPATWTGEQFRGWAAFEKMVREQGAQTAEPWKREGRRPGTVRRRHPPRKDP